MRQTPVTGFMLHTRAYRETSKLCSFFSAEFGLIRAVARKSVPLFQHLQVSMTGKQGLKSLSKPEHLVILPALADQALYAGLYLNELLYRLLPELEPYPETFSAYAAALELLSTDNPLEPTALKRLLRQTELVLLKEHGYEISFEYNSQQDPIDSQIHYHYDPQSGWIPVQAYSPDHPSFAGSWILAFNPQQILDSDLSNLGRLCRICLDQLLDHKPLETRKLWQQLYT